LLTSESDGSWLF